MNQTAFRIAQQAMDEEAPPAMPKATEGDAEQNAGKNPAAVFLGRLGGLKGGKARANSLSAEQRSEIAKKAAASRWAKKTEQ